MNKKIHCQECTCQTFISKSAYIAATSDSGNPNWKMNFSCADCKKIVSRSIDHFKPFAAIVGVDLKTFSPCIKLKQADLHVDVEILVEIVCEQSTTEELRHKLEWLNEHSISDEKINSLLRETTLKHLKKKLEVQQASAL